MFGRSHATGSLDHRCVGDPGRVALAHDPRFGRATHPRCVTFRAHAEGHISFPSWTAVTIPTRSPTAALRMRFDPATLHCWPRSLTRLLFHRTRATSPCVGGYKCGAAALQRRR